VFSVLYEVILFLILFRLILGFKLLNITLGLILAVEITRHLKVHHHRS
jgi:hypothetical protein